MENVLVTGSAGFIGSHLTRELLNENKFHIVALDDLSGGFIDNIPDGVEFIEGSIVDDILIKNIFAKYRFKYVYHLAAYAAEGLSHFIRRYNYLNNLIGSINLINESVRTNVECFVFTSSIAVYGSNQVPMREDMVPEPEDPYGISKLAVEQDLRAAKEMFGLNYVIFRPHNVYGEFQNIGDKYRNVVGIFMNQILQDQPLTIFGDGLQQRAFSYVGDIVGIMARAAWNKKAHNQVFNVGADTPYTVNSLVGEICRAMGRQQHPVDHVEERNEVKIAYSDHSKVKKYFGEVASTNLEEGLYLMVSWISKAGARKSRKFGHIEIDKNLPPAWLTD